MSARLLPEQGPENFGNPQVCPHSPGSGPQQRCLALTGGAPDVAAL